MPEPTADPRRPPPPPPMVLVDRCVRFVDELLEFIKETGGLSLHESIDSALKRLPALPECSSSSRRSIDREAQKQMAIQDEMERYKVEVQVPALARLRKRQASRPSSATVRREPLPQALDGCLYQDLLDGMEPCLSPGAASAPPPIVTRLSLKISWPPGHLLSGYPCSAFFTTCHYCFLVLYVGTYSPWSQDKEPGFYLVYNTFANSIAIVPPLFWDYMSCSDIGPGVAVLCCSMDMEEGDYVLAHLLLHRDVRTLLLTNKATLFIWASASPRPRSWVQREVVLPLPLPAAAADADDNDDNHKDTTTGSFHADMVFAVSFSSICWVDLLTGILVYNHIPSGQFHFIPLPEECGTTSLLRDGPRGQCDPDTYRSMCCVDRQTLKLVAMDESYRQDCPMLTTWTLRRPLSPANWKWEKDAVSSFCIKDLWEDQVYKDQLLQPLSLPHSPVISTQEPGIIYLLVTDYKHSRSHYVLSLNMDRCRVESVYKVPSDKNAITPPPRLFTSDFSRYLNKTIRVWELMHGARDVYEGPIEGEGEDS